MGSPRTKRSWWVWLVKKPIPLIGLTLRQFAWQGHTMLKLALLLLRTTGSALRCRSQLLAENLALRQQLAVLQRRPGRPRLRQTDRQFWVLVRWLWSGWKGALVLVQPATVVRWHRQAFKSYWTRISRQGRRGRPQVSREIRELVRHMAVANPLWGAPRIHGELP